MSTPERGALGVVGLGYIGLPLAVLAREKGWHVVGVDVRKDRVERINDGQPPFHDERLRADLAAHPIAATTDVARLRDADVIVIAVPTPVDEEARPDLRPLRAAVDAVAKESKRGVLLSIESTINPGVCEEEVVPLLMSRGRDPAGGDILLVHCPERVNPGDARWTVRNIPRVFGGLTREATERGLAFYRSILEAPIRPMSSIRAAEAVKITENVFRDVNIAFVNELAQSFDQLGIDVHDVISGAATKPFAFMAHYPGCGVGGHCIPVDPYYLIEHAQRHGFDHRFLQLARHINKGMPRYTVERLMTAWQELAGGQPEAGEKSGRLAGVRVALLGLAYKQDIDDVRESPAFDIERLLRAEGAAVLAYDPFVPDRSTAGSLTAALAAADAVVIATGHSVFRALTPRDFSGTPVRVIVDGRNCLDMEQFASSAILYRGIGRTSTKRLTP